jgi:hypothetical protein
VEVEEQEVSHLGKEEEEERWPWHRQVVEEVEEEVEEAVALLFDPPLPWSREPAPLAWE